MITLYRERRRIDRPPELVVRELSATLGDPDDENRERGVWEWHYATLGGLYRYRVVVDAGRGRLAVDVGAPRAFGAIAASALLVAPAVLLLGGSEVVFAAVLWGYAGVAVYPVAHRLPGVPGDPPAVGGTVLTGQRLTGYAIPGSLAVAATLWAGVGAAGAGPAVVASVAGLCLLGGGVYWIAGRPLGDSRGPDADGSGTDGAAHDPNESDDADLRPGLPVTGIALSGVLPALLTLGNGLVAVHVVTADPRPVAVALAAVVVFALDAAFFAYCRLVVESYEGARIVQAESAAVRVALVVLVGGANAVLAGAAVVGLDVLRTVATGSEAGPAVRAVVPAAAAGVQPGSLSGPLLAVLALGAVVPLATVALGWIYHLLATVGGGVWTLATAEPLSDAPGAAGDVRVADLGGPVARPAGVPGRRFVLVDRSLVAALSDEQLAAILAHERAHLDLRDPATSLLVGLASLLVGGRNVVLSLSDYPGIEARADRRAAEAVGTDALVGALRTMETLRVTAGDGAGLESGTGAGAGGSTPGDRSRLDLAVATLVAPGRLLFGPVVLDRSHRSVDERIARLLAE